MTLTIDTVPIGELHRALGFDDPIVLPPAWRNTPLSEWQMVADGQLLRQIFRRARPMRHLEFGTWMGDGVLRCVEECDATVWTINLLEGESRDGGGWAYGEAARPEWNAARPWSQRDGPRESEGVRTDAYGMVGFNYLHGGWGHRVCQIYADSRKWDTRAYPDGFFDTALIDGGHTAPVVESDTRNALRLVRAGGLVMWHDFCPDQEVMRGCGSTRGVYEVITTHLAEVAPSLRRLLWVDPSWLLIGVHR